MQEHAHESGVAIVAKITPPAGISLATVFGVQVSELLVWATLLYTVLLIGHKAYTIYKDIRNKPKPEQ
jgi:hypothetical protein